MDSHGVNTIIIVVTVMVALVGLITIYTTVAGPIETFKDEILSRMDSHTGPIKNFWTVFKVGGAAMFIFVLLWAVLAGQEDEYESSRRRTDIPV